MADIKNIFSFIPEVKKPEEKNFSNIAEIYDPRMLCRDIKDDTGFSKPDEETFYNVLEDIPFKPENILFVDDNEENMIFREMF